jgi:hypothetical protein
MKSLFDLECLISKQYLDIVKNTEEYFSMVSNQSVEVNVLTKCILKRLKSFYEYQYALNSFYNRGYTPPASDFFTETVLYYLKVYFKINNIHYDIKSEVSLKKKRGSIRPDISIWEGEKVVAIIECKTQLGYNRHGWQDHFHERERKLVELFPNAKAFLLVMTTLNWENNQGFSSYDERGTKYFTLTNQWPASIDFSKNDHEYIVDSIEPLFKQIIDIRK